ncbi:hypothetical protein B0T16DRAFT_454731 [Cercophora newfieldiana]|uniref:Uncharacterized protein n=1 Tax=Cercophora newfieldiana TaxID=92897 RepID=A0AA40CUZ0_9PEZI|nr:hypothetical protein B0T16DRAFT_454731 [Cercophora newfieldiana]
MKVPTEIMQKIVQHVAHPIIPDQQTAAEDVRDPSSTSPPTYPIITTTQFDTAAAQALQTLFNLCLVSHALYDITLPILYREFALGYDDIHGSCFPRQMGQRMVAFARTLLTRRDLAGLVKRAFLHPGLVGQMGWENRKMVSELAKRKLKAEGGGWGGGGGGGEVFDGLPIEGLMYALMPNLERLVFAGREGALASLVALREVAWENLERVEQTETYGESFTELEARRRQEEELTTMIACGSCPLPDEDDGDL